LALDEVESHLREIETGNGYMRRYGLLVQAVRISTHLKGQMDALNANVQAELDSAQEGVVRIPPQLEDEVRERAAHEAFMSTMADLNRAWHEGRMTVDEYVAALRGFGKTHFATVVLPAISR
jgi:hypothetical protein